jgi:hypothetical protein
LDGEANANTNGEDENRDDLGLNHVSELLLVEIG